VGYKKKAALLAQQTTSMDEMHARVLVHSFDFQSFEMTSRDGRDEES
jgi:hypothetical protein